MLPALLGQTKSSRIGAIGESLALRHLLSAGFSIVERNFEIPGAGEVDIIACKDGILHFIEVKSSETVSIGDPGHSAGKITSKKIRSLQRVMTEYCLRRSVAIPRCISAIYISFSRETRRARVYFDDRLYIDSI